MSEEPRADPDEPGPPEPDPADLDRVDYELDDVRRQLADLKATVDSPEERHGVRTAMAMLDSVPGGDRIRRYTTRDVAEGAVGAIVFSLPLLVEDGVFDIGEWLAGTTAGGIPVFLVANVAFIVLLTAGLLYATGFRDVVPRRLFGIVPRRLLAVLTISFCVTAALMLAWGRLHEGDPTTLEAFARVTVIWAAAALGASVADMIPGESEGTDLGDRVGGGRSR